ncbi:MAG: acetyl-CoA carboxylase biotin carboxyl carrier protein subunit [Chloroflexi bacterium]|nr:acetyl-CoA carboxylase biotin carboxyl carrier protein subunit [Chloroflexota bacterium]
MRKFKVTIEDETFEVVVEEVKAARQPAGLAQASAVGVARAAVAAAPRAARASAPVAVAEAGALCASSPCTIASIKVEVGASVNEGDTLLITESMKMQTPINAKCAGKVKEIYVKQGQFVKRGAPLIILE